MKQEAPVGLPGAFPGLLGWLAYRPECGKKSRWCFQQTTNTGKTYLFTADTT
jgi:hypothetical protein